jgi:hypothetical protein
MGATVFFADSSELATLTNTFTVAGVATDPSTVSLIVTDPTGSSTTYTFAGGTVTKVSTGKYSKDVACATAGTWAYEWVGTGTASDATAGTWEVLDTSLGHLYAPMAMLKSRLGIPDSDTTDDFELHGACFAASRSIEQYCERTFYRSSSAERTFEARGYYRLDLPEYNDLVSVTTFATDSSGDGVAETVWSTTDYQLLPYNPSAAPEQKPYTKVKAINRTFPVVYPPMVRTDLVHITGVWGWPSVPWAIKQATLILAAEMFKLKDAPFGIAGFGDFGVLRIRDNPKLAAYAGPYRRNPMVLA